MDKEEDNKTTRPNIYPIPTKGPLSDDHSSYAKPKSWAGADPDKYNRLYLIGFLIIIGILFIVAVKSLSGEEFFF